MNGRCIVLKSPCNTEIMEFPVPHPKPGALVLRMHRCSVCSSDVHIWKGEHPSPRYAKNFVMGHEGVGEILELGEGVETDWAGLPVKAGDRVIPANYVRCGKCYACLHGNGQLCMHTKMDYYRDALSWPHYIGTFGTHMYVLPVQPFFKIPDGVPDNVAASANCAMSTAYAAVDRSGLKNGENIVIQGAGALGLHAASIAHERGARVITVEGKPERIALAKEFGADEVVDLREYPDKESRLKRIRELTGGYGPEVVIELTGQASAHEEAYEIAAPGGRFIPTGIAWAHIKVTITPSYNGRKMLDVLQSFHYKPIHLKACMEFLERNLHKYPYEKLCDAEYEFEDFDRLMADMEARRVLRPNLIPRLPGT